MRILLVVLALVVAGCSHKADVTATPAYDLVTSYSNQVPGKWLLYVDGEATNEAMRTLSRELGEAFANSPAIRQGVRI